MKINNYNTNLQTF